MTNVLPPYDFSRQPEPSDFRYYYTDFGNDPVRQMTADIIQPALQESLDRFGITTERLAPWSSIPNTDDPRPAHILVGPMDPLKASRSERAQLYYLAQQGARVHVVPAIPADDATRKLADAEVPKFDRRHIVKTIYPTLEVDGVRTSSTADIRDNQVHETIRTKYSSERNQTPRYERWLEEAKLQAVQTVSWLSSLYRGMRLYDRAPTDGSVMVTTDYGWLVSQVKTDKTTLTVDDMSLVLSNGTEGDHLNYVGQRLPSSRTPELLTMVNGLIEGKMAGGHPQMVVHFHDNESARGGKAPEVMGREVIEYGIASSGLILARDMLDTPTGGLIMPEQGVVWAGRRLNDFAEFLSTTLGKDVPTELL